MSPTKREPPVTHPVLDAACAQLRALADMMGLDYVSMTVERSGRVVFFAADESDAADAEPAWTTVARVPPSTLNAPGPTEAIRETSDEIAELSRRRHGTLTPEERRKTFRRVK